VRGTSRKVATSADFLRLLPLLLLLLCLAFVLYLDLLPLLLLLCLAFVLCLDLLFR
jgi:hypothetical protein